MKINDNTDPAAKGLAAYTIQELYEKYDDYLFDWETFYMDPERYTFTEDDIMYWNLRELKNYEFDVPMTPAEKRALRKWVASGHSVRELPGCLPDGPGDPPGTPRENKGRAGKIPEGIHGMV